MSAQACGLSAVVTAASRAPLRRAVECVAYYFRREFEYSFIQYCAAEPEDQTLHRAYVWTDPATLKDDKETVIDACCFRWREWRDAPAGYSLDFVWLHPYQRAKGVLERAWAYFQKRFEQQFFVQDPLSKGMARFLRTQGHEPRGVPVERLRIHGTQVW